MLDAVAELVLGAMSFVREYAWQIVAAGLAVSLFLGFAREANSDNRVVRAIGRRCKGALDSVGRGSVATWKATLVAASLAGMAVCAWGAVSLVRWLWENPLF